MKINQRLKPAEELYIQVWRNPIFYGELLADVNAEQWHTLTGLAVFMNGDGECNPSLSKLKQILGLSSIASVSRRIKSLEFARFNGYPLIEVIRKKRVKNAQGKWTYINNHYQLNQQVITIFATANDPTSVYSRQYAEKNRENKAKHQRPLYTDEKRNEDNITRKSS